MIKTYIEENFGNKHLVGFEYFVRACELYEPNINISTIYEIVGREFNVKGISIERDIRYYINKMTGNPQLKELLGFSSRKPQNKKVIEAIKYKFTQPQ